MSKTFKTISILVCLIILSSAGAAVAGEEALTYAVTLSWASTGAAWTQTAQVNIAPAGDSLEVTLRSFTLTVEQASNELRPTIEKAYGGFDGASAVVKIDDHGNILSVGNVTSPSAGDIYVPASAVDFSRIVGLCIFAMPASVDRAALKVGDSWPADSRTAAPNTTRVNELSARAERDAKLRKTLKARVARLEATRMRLADITEKDGRRIGRFVFAYEPGDYKHSRTVHVDLASGQVIKATADIRSGSGKKTSTMIMTAELVK